MTKFESLESKKQFLVNQFISDSIRDAHGWSGIIRGLNKNEKNKNGEKIREKVCEVLLDIFEEYSDDEISYEEHFIRLKNYSENITNSCIQCLKDEYRIGITQKVINMFLKYCWCADIIENEPPHFPIDEKIINEISKISDIKRKVNKIKWTQITSIDVYRELINIVKEKIGESDSLANWELEKWNYKDK